MSILFSKRLLLYDSFSTVIGKRHACYVFSACFPFIRPIAITNFNMKQSTNLLLPYTLACTFIEAITVLLLNTIISIIELSNSYTRLMIAIIDSSVIFTIYFIINKYNFHITDINKFYYKYGKNNNKNFYIILLLSFSSLFYLFYIFKRFGLMEFDLRGFF